MAHPDREAEDEEGGGAAGSGAGLRSRCGGLSNINTNIKKHLVKNSLLSLL